MQKDAGKKMEQLVSHMMLDMGVPAHLKGYRYVRTAVLMAEEDMKVVGSVTKLLYPEIAKRYNTTDGKVERAIRNAIEISWERGNKETFENLFGYCADNGQGRPTNSEYIAAMADTIRIQMKPEKERENGG
ncbi:MAG: sporulation initiation factor Spo0A C-terminal domain-containing protein [Lachnospiraceae bacterium]|nr:sporulation initiation factor Spo0A C-terminal domain-containing protein [Lachnospiraceae bacterium]MDE7334008.1 sporulation initiation factor Spo0A C-terminal domain-containing protein [Lachnospiraceae bacterium]